MTTLPDIIGEFVSDAITGMGDAAKVMVPGAALAGGAVSRYLRRRTEQARDILMEELRRANRTEEEVASEDESIAVIYRYLRAAREGAARLNLRLLAKVIAGQFATGSAGGRRIPATCGSARGAVARRNHRDRHDVDVHGAPAAQPRTAWHGSESRPWGMAKRALSDRGMNDELVMTAATRAQRSGYVVGTSAFGGTGFRVSPFLIELGKTVDFDDALRRESHG